MSSSPNGSLASVNGGGFMAFPAATTCLGAPTSEASGGCKRRDSRHVSIGHGIALAKHGRERLPG
eukprot:3593117-Rhodomonas_salina.1